MARIREALDGEGRVVLLTGTGGIGKTWLAREVLAAEESASFVDLSSVRDTAGCALAIASAIGAHSTSAPELGRAMARHSHLWILDNLEQIEGSLGALVAEWSRHCRLLLTSRVLLQVRARDGSPTNTVTIDVPPLPRADAESLFRRHAADPSARSESLLDALGGNALAILLAASHTQLESPDQILERLLRGKRLFDLEGEHPPHHASLDALAERSWDLLEPVVQEGLSQLLCFAGWFTAAQAESVGVGLPFLVRIQRASLILRSQRAGQVTHAVHPALLPSLRGLHPPDLARWRLHASATLHRVETRAEQATRADDPRTYLATLAELAPDLEAIASHPGLPPDHGARARLALLHIYGHYDVARAETLLSAGRDDGDHLSPRQRLSLDIRTSRILRRRGRPQEAQRHLERAVQRSQGGERAELLAEQALLLVHAEAPERGLAVADEALAALRSEHVEGAQLRVALRARGTALRLLGREEAREALLEALEAAGSNDFAKINVCSQLIRVEPDPADRRRWYAEALGAARSAAPGDARVEGVVHHAFAMVQLSHGELIAAEGPARLAREALTEAGDARAVLDLDTQLLCLRLGIPGREPSEAELARCEAGASPSDSNAGRLRAARGLLAHLDGRLDVARRLYREAEVIGKGSPPLDELTALLDAEEGTGSSVATGSEVVTHAQEAWRGGSGAALKVVMPMSGAWPIRWVGRAAARALEQGWRLADDGSAIRPPNGACLAVRRPLLRRLLRALVAAHRAEPGSTLSSQELIAAGWPGESMSTSSAKNRLYVAVRDLRTAGLEGLLQTIDGGYRLDPDQQVRGIA